MPYAIEILGGVFLGQPIPDGLRCFDCRTSDDAEIARAPWSFPIRGKLVSPMLFGSDTAAVDLGLRGRGFQEDTSPISGSGYNCREAGEAVLAVQDMIKGAHRLQQEWDEACSKPPSTDGGSLHYKPLALALSNYGWCVICDQRVYRLVAIES